MVHQMGSVALGGVVSLTAVGSIPGSLAPGAAGLRTGFATGVSRVGSVLPAAGSIVGAGLVIKSTKKLKKSSKKLLKGGSV